MVNSEIEKRTLGDELLETGWQQGALFNAPSANFMYNKLSDDTNGLIIQQLRKTESKEKFVLTTQDCDIKSSDEPFVEALLCKPVRPKFLGNITPKSARWFVIDYESRLVAHAMYRVQFAKQVLKILTPEPWPNGHSRLDEFVRWLARRYDRPAIPDSIYEVFQRPLEERIALLENEKPAAFAAFNRVVRDVRVNLPASEYPPFNLQLILLINPEGLSEEEANAINLFEQTIRAGLDANLVILDPELRILTEEEISMAEYYASRPMYLDYYT